jgi:uncharacterized SAM-binding protein YcdF (DUF218 family)
LDSFVILKILAALCTPPASLAVGVMLALVLAALHRRRLGQIVLWLAIAHTLVLSFQPVGDALTRYLENRARAAERQAAPCCYDAIVVLGGGIAPAHPPDQPLPDLNEDADRIWQAARLWRRGVAPRIIVTGGSFLAQQADPPTTEAEAMRVFLLDLGVPSEAIVSEGEALNTIENIRNVRAIVGDGRVALVTSAFHMPRALQIAARAKLKVGAFPTDYQAVSQARLPWDDWLPSVDGLRMSTMALREIIALNLDFRQSRLDP